MNTVRFLASYHYARKFGLHDLLAPARDAGYDIDLFADSGAFTAYTTGAKIDRAAYTDWLREHARAVNVAAALDVIGDWRASAVNADWQRDHLGDTVTIVPAFHTSSPWSEFRRLCREWPYVALGGAVIAIHRPQMVAWLVKCHRIAEETGTRLHGFGLTKPPIPELLPWYSVDSVYWMSARRTGSMSLFDTRTHAFVKFRVGTRSVFKHPDVLHRYGMTATQAASPGFGLIGKRGEIGRQEVAWLFRASLQSWLMYEQSIRRRRVVKPPDNVTGDGPKIYFAVSNLENVQTVTDAYSTMRAVAA